MFNQFIHVIAVTKPFHVIAVTKPFHVIAVTKPLKSRYYITPLHGAISALQGLFV
jgi:hypothetical protein